MRKLVRQAAPRFTAKLQPAPCLCRDPELARQTLRIPRRPEWTEDMTAAELNQLENEAFLKWRAQIAMCVCAAWLSPWLPGAMHCPTARQLQGGAAVGSAWPEPRRSDAVREERGGVEAAVARH